MGVTQEEKDSEHHTLMFTLMTLEQEGQEYFVSPFGFGFIPLMKVNRSYVQGIFQLPIYTEKMNSYIYELMQHINPWAVIKEIENNQTIKQSQSTIVLKVRLNEYEGWLEMEDTLHMINRMFLTNSENYPKLTEENMQQMLNAPRISGSQLSLEEKEEYEQMIVEYFKKVSASQKGIWNNNTQQNEEADDENSSKGDDDEVKDDENSQDK